MPGLGERTLRRLAGRGHGGSGLVMFLGIGAGPKFILGGVRTGVEKSKLFMARS
jgi:hypothetical protein